MTGKKTRGYTKELMILPFDHRGSFQEKMFGYFGKLTPEQTKEIASYKNIVFDGFEKAVKAGLPADKMGILVDEQFGYEVIDQCKKKHISLSIPAEKSGQDEFDFEYPEWKQHIEKVNPEFLKVLVRYNPEGDKAVNARQAKKLAELSKYLETSPQKYLFELLVPATKEQLERCKGDKKVFDVELRPKLMVQAIHELLNAGVEPDIWKLEGVDRKEDCAKVCEAARSGGRTDVGCIVLGRGENEAKVREWLEVGADVPGVIGFAVGRTIFWEPLKSFREKKITRDQAVDQVAKNYTTFCKIWMDARNA